MMITNRTSAHCTGAKLPIRTPRTKKPLLWQLIFGFCCLFCLLGPIYGREPILKKNWAERLQYVGVILEEVNYHIWGSSPIWGNDGKVHIFASRIPVAEDKPTNGFNQLWYTHSEIAHYVSDKPEGPFKFVEVLLKPGQAPPGSWDSGTQHNPSIKNIDGLFVLTYISNTTTATIPYDRKTTKWGIGMMTAKDINGPWKKVGMVLEDSTNPALVKHPNGKYYMYPGVRRPLNMYGGNAHGVAIADKLEGPYLPYPDVVVNNSRYIEDPYVFVYDQTIYMLVTDNTRSKALLLTSEDGLHFEFNEGVLGFDNMAAYIPTEKVDAAPNYRHPKFERPQLLLKDGAPTYLYAPGGANINGGKGTCCYLFKILPVAADGKS